MCVLLLFACFLDYLYIFYYYFFDWRVMKYILTVTHWSCWRWREQQIHMYVCLVHMMPTVILMQLLCFFPRNIPSHMEPLRPWLNHTVSQEVIGADPTNCFVFLPLNQTYDDLPIVQLSWLFLKFNSCSQFLTTLFLTNSSVSLSAVAAIMRFTSWQY